MAGDKVVKERERRGEAEKRAPPPLRLMRREGGFMISRLKFVVAGLRRGFSEFAIRSIHYSCPL